MIDSSDGAFSTTECAQLRHNPACKTLSDFGETHESFPMAQMCQYEPINVTVGDVLVFKRKSLADDVFSLPSQWHYAECNFTDGGEPLLPPDDSSTPTNFQ